MLLNFYLYLQTLTEIAEFRPIETTEPKARTWYWKCQRDVGMYQVLILPKVWSWFSVVPRQTEFWRSCINQFIQSSLASRWFWKRVLGTHQAQAVLPFKYISVHEVMCKKLSLTWVGQAEHQRGTPYCKWGYSLRLQRSHKSALILLLCMPMSILTASLHTNNNNKILKIIRSYKNHPYSLIF